jgi:hypothetical protein
LAPPKVQKFPEGSHFGHLESHFNALLSFGKRADARSDKNITGLGYNGSLSGKLMTNMSEHTARCAASVKFRGIRAFLSNRCDETEPVITNDQSRLSSRTPRTLVREILPRFSIPQDDPSRVYLHLSWLIARCERARYRAKANSISYIGNRVTSPSPPFPPTKALSGSPR